MTGPQNPAEIYEYFEVMENYSYLEVYKGIYETKVIGRTALHELANPKLSELPFGLRVIEGERIRDDGEPFGVMYYAIDQDGSRDFYRPLAPSPIPLETNDPKQH